MMKHQNPAMNVTLPAARALREYLNRIGFAVEAIEGNPNVLGQRSSSMCPEVNLPQDGAPMNLEFRFQAVKDSYPVAQIRDIVTYYPGLSDISSLYATLWPNSSINELAGRLYAVPEILESIDSTLTRIGSEVFRPEQDPEQEPEEATVTQSLFSAAIPTANED